MTSCYDIPKLITSVSLPFIQHRLNIEPFQYTVPTSGRTYPSCLTSNTCNQFRGILHDVINSVITPQQAIQQVSVQLPTPPRYKKIKNWDERLIRTELSKIFTLGYGDFLLSIGETHCFIPPTGYDTSAECRRLIEGKVFPIATIQNNVYANYVLKSPQFPTVPQHPNCRHVIVPVPNSIRPQYDIPVNSEVEKIDILEE